MPTGIAIVMDEDYDPHFGHLLSDADITRLRQLDDLLAEIRAKLCVFLNLPIES
jgi:hypothetical protein